MTLGTVIVGSIAIYAAVHTNNRRLGADIFLRYSDRISDLRRSLPISAFVEQEVSSNVEKTPEERRAVHEVIYSIFELYELKVYGFLPHAIWKIREPDIEALLSLPFFQHELAAFENRFARHPRFARWLDQVRVLNYRNQQLNQRVPGSSPGTPRSLPKPATESSLVE